MASNPKARTESATIQNGTQLLIETRRSAKSVWLYFCTKYFLSIATDAGEDPAPVVDWSSHFEKSIFAGKMPQGLTRPPCNVLMIYKLFLDFALIGVIMQFRLSGLFASGVQK
jgi:hypothetical protein